MVLGNVSSDIDPKALGWNICLTLTHISYTHLFLFHTKVGLSIYPLFSLDKKGLLISYKVGIPACFFFQKKKVYSFLTKVGLSSVCLSIMFLVTLSSPKPLDVTTSNFAGAQRSHDGNVILYVTFNSLSRPQGWCTID